MNTTIDNRTTCDTEATEELFDAVKTALEEFGIADARGDHATNWHALRIKPDGEIYTVQEVSPCYSESEYFNRVPHTLTIHSQRGNCYTPSADENPGWAINDDGTLNLDEWVGDRPDADYVCYQWREILQNWIDAGNVNTIELSVRRAVEQQAELPGGKTIIHDTLTNTYQEWK